LNLAQSPGVVFRVIFFLNLFFSLLIAVEAGGWRGRSSQEEEPTSGQGRGARFLARMEKWRNEEIDVVIQVVIEVVIFTW
jgi:hypothetical protein